MFEQLKETLKEIEPGTVTDKPLMRWYYEHEDFFKNNQMSIFNSDLQDRHFGFLFRTTNKDILQKIGTDKDFYDLTHYHYFQGGIWRNEEMEVAYSEKDIIRLISKIQFLIN